MTYQDRKKNPRQSKGAETESQSAGEVPSVAAKLAEESAKNSKLESAAPISTSQAALPAVCTTLLGEELVERDIEDLIKGLWRNLKLSDAIVEEITTWTNKLAKGKRSHILVLAIRATFKTVMESDYFHDDYAKLLRNLMSNVGPNVQDDDIVDSEGCSLAGSQLFRKHLLNQCAEEFERSWNIGDRRPIDHCHRSRVIKFITELFNVRVVAESTMHEYIKAILAPGCTSTRSGKAADELVEVICILFKGIGALLDTPASRALMDEHFSHLTTLSRDARVGSLMRMTAKVILPSMSQ